MVGDDEIDNLPDGSPVLMAWDFDPASEGELKPMATAFVRHCCEKRHKMYFLALFQPVGQQMIDNSIAELRESYPVRDIRVEAGTGAVRAIGNQLSVEQILTNLLANALKYSEDGPIEVVVDETPDRLTVRVRDHGPGIPAAEQERIFERFHRMDQHHVQAGTGLGLYISRRLALSMHGDLTVDSAPGRGATFSLQLPAEVHLVAVG